MGALNSFRDLRVYQEMKRLHLERITEQVALESPPPSTLHPPPSTAL